MARKKKRQEEHPDERWLITYADVLTLLFVLFMVMFSMSVVNTGKYEKLRDSLSASLSAGIFDSGKSVAHDGSEVVPAEQPPGPQAPQQPAPVEGLNLRNAPTEAALESSQLEAAKKVIDDETQRSGVGAQVTTSIDEMGLKVRLRTDPFLFASGSADLGPGANRLLGPVSRAVGRLVNPVVVEGHTDTDPIATAQFPNNYFLGAARACTVLGALRQRGVARAQDCRSRGASQPVIDNSTARNKAQNRRVEILVLRINAVSGQNP